MKSPEGFEKDEIKDHLNEYVGGVRNDCWFFSPYMAGYGKSGVPDIVACINGKFVSIEVKREGKEPTALQWQRMAEIGLAGGFTCWGTAARVIPLLKNLNA